MFGVRGFNEATTITPAPENEGFDYRRLLPTNNNNNAGFTDTSSPSSHRPPLSSFWLLRSSRTFLSGGNNDISNDLENEGFENNNNNDGTDNSCFSSLPCCFTLSWHERLLGSLTCIVAGMLLNLGTWWWKWYSLQTLVLNTTLANLMQLLGSFFWTGPTAQCTRMMQPQRQTATILYLGAVFLTLVVASVRVPGPQRLYLLILLPCQSLSITWYTLSYIPYAHHVIKSFVSRRLLNNSNASSEY